MLMTLTLQINQVDDKKKHFPDSIHNSSFTYMTNLSEYLYEKRSFILETTENSDGSNLFFGGANMALTKIF